jgi:hypothetical protein
MFPLDPRTVDRVARLVCDIDGPFERSGRDLEELLRNAGWPDPPEYDGSPRIPWLIEALTERRRDQGAVERLLCRVCDPLEYDDGMASADLMRRELNGVLEAERLTVSYLGNRPVLGELGEDGSTPIYTEPVELAARLGRLIRDHRTIECLMARVAETRICETNGAYLFAIIGIGTFVEGLLHAILTERDDDVRRQGFENPRGRDRIRADRAGLEVLIHAAHARGWIQLDAKDFVDKVRDYRNFVHPRRQLELGMVPDRDTVMLCWAPVRAVLNDLEESLPTDEHDARS